MQPLGGKTPHTPLHSGTNFSRSWNIGR